MSATIERRPDGMRFGRLADWFDLPEFTRLFEKARFDDLIRIEEQVTDDRVEIRAEIPGIDPDNDVDITVVDGMLTITAERRAEDRSDENGRTFSEFRYGSFVRSIAVPKATVATDVTARYNDGILTVSVPRPKVMPPAAAKVAVTR